ncbi:MAG: hypothetical protein KJ057_11045 [Phycisphaerae bacterium]|nr:MAG: hypothetical protein EDS66_02530 [Planctomycetota bacterium]KAB2936701.1 MAG: hypothetical protein F9K17_16680 [Phycisphaerae bacterium]MBE7457128.1 hypothetical protein [Planctomycetia bacterium]MCK6463513.1 hypothetical protein [Phycisphaerae bacterium]MCL4718995.1 hypothetical protein [Phycisphaerae bacterium]
MTAIRGWIRQGYDLAAVFSMLNLLALAGVAAYLVVGGHLTPERVRQVVEVMRGTAVAAPEEGLAGDGAGAEGAEPATDDAPAAAESTGVIAEEPIVAARPRTSSDLTQTSLIEREIALRERNRFEVEINQRLALSESIMLQITTRLDELNARRAAFEKAKQEEAGVKDEEGFRKELEVFNSLKPTQAFDYLIRKDADQAARLLMEMDTRTVAKILESAKSAEHKAKADEILSAIRKVAPARAAEVAGEAQTP